MSFTGCARENATPQQFGWTAPLYEEGEIVSDIDGAAIFIDSIAYINSVDTLYHQFVTTGDVIKVAGANLPSVGSQIRHEIRKKHDGKIFRQELCYGTVAAATSEMERYYYDGANAFYVEDDKFCKSDNDVFYPNFSNTSYKAFTGDIELNNYTYDNFSYYVINQDSIIDVSDMYLYQDKYYLKVTIDCYDYCQEGVEKKTLDELGGTALVWDDNSVFTLEFIKVGEEFRLTAYELNAYYTGTKKFGLFNIQATIHQTLSGTLEYDLDSALINSGDYS